MNYLDMYHEVALLLIVGKMQKETYYKTIIPIEASPKKIKKISDLWVIKKSR